MDHVTPFRPVPAIRPAAELPASLERLSTAELLGPAESAGEHAFRHPLAQEVAYRTQLLDHRRGTHAAIARALLTIHSSEAATHAALKAPELVVTATYDGKSETVQLGRAGTDAYAGRADEPGSAKLETTPYEDALKALDALK